MFPEDEVPICQHVKTNGVRCQNPALRRQRYCYFHHQTLGRAAPRARNSRSKTPALTLPLLEDANAVQIAINQVVGALLDGTLEPRHATILLYALQTASANMKHVNFRPYWKQVVTTVGGEGDAPPLRSTPNPEIELPSGDKTLDVLRKILPMGKD